MIASLTRQTCILSVVIVNFNAKELLQQCLENLFSLSLPDSEILVIDNGSSDGSAEWLLEQHLFPIQAVCLPNNIGFAAGCNEGIVRSQSKYVLLLNTDAFPIRGAVEILVDYLEQHSTVGIAGPQLLYPDGRWQFSTALVLSVRTAFFSALGITTIEHLLARLMWRYGRQFWRPHTVGVIAGASMLIRRTMLETIGLLDSSFFFFAEDVELCHRAKLCGWQVRFVPQSQVVHLRGGSSFRKMPTDTLVMRRDAERAFILTTYGQDAWKKYVFWTCVGYHWRAALARFLGQSERFSTYRAALNIYLPDSK